MNPTTLNRIAALGGTAFVAEGALELAHSQNEPFTVLADYLIEGAFALGLLMTVAGLIGVHLRQERAAGAFGLWAARIAVAGQGALGVCAVATLLRGHEVLGPLFGLGLLCWLAGSVALGIATARARVHGTAVAVLVGALPVVALALGGGGLFVAGAAWIALGLSDRRVLRPVPAAA